MPPRAVTIRRTRPTRRRTAGFCSGTCRSQKVVVRLVEVVPLVVPRPVPVAVAAWARSRQRLYVRARKNAPKPKKKAAGRAWPMKVPDPAMTRTVGCRVL